uniref:Uncharacterized protein n=1 Tax=Gouania willdenowi TaxID=441366 RepID=A0A8C5GPQ8_GOUWI
MFGHAPLYVFHGSCGVHKLLFHSIVRNAESRWENDAVPDPWLITEKSPASDFRSPEFFFYHR